MTDEFITLSSKVDFRDPNQRDPFGGVSPAAGKVMRDMETVWEFFDPRNSLIRGLDEQEKEA